jgi:ribonuclease R
VHRILQALLTNVNEPYNVQTLNSFADTTSAQERNAQDAERSSIKLKQMEYLLARKENIFTGRITNINGWGAFVEEQTSACEGFIKVELFPKECVFDEKKLRIENKITNQIWRIGDELPIKVANVDMDRKEVDFKLA